MPVCANIPFRPRGLLKVVWLVEIIFGGYCLCFSLFFVVIVCVALEEWLHMKIVILLIPKSDHIGFI